MLARWKSKPKAIETGTPMPGPALDMNETSSELFRHDRPPAPLDPARPYLLALRKLGRTFGEGEAAVHALSDATLDIYAGEILVIVGPSGSGKSTLLNMIGGMDRPTRGALWFKDKPLGQFTDYELTLYRRDEVGFVFQFYNLIPSLTALENVEVVTDLAKRPMDAGEALKLVGLAHRGDHFPAHLSGGEQQRVAIARAIASTPSLLLADEPTGALDSNTSRVVMGLMTRMNRERGDTVVLITHNQALAQLGHRVASIRDGRIASLHINEKPVAAEDLEW